MKIEKNYNEKELRSKASVTNKCQDSSKTNNTIKQPGLRGENET